MKTTKPTNMAASVRARLLKIAKESGEEFTYVLTRYGLERLLARLAGSRYRDAFVLKGAMLFRVWSPRLHRPTKDLDLLGSGPPELDRLVSIFAEVCSAVVPDDGVTFDPKSVHAQRIKQDAEYEGVRVNVTAHVGSARLELQIDVGFGDAVTPEASTIDFPTLLTMPPEPRLRAYPRETVVAEKVQAMEHLGIASSRMKDFFDVWFLSQGFAFDGSVLSAALRATFERRGTPIPVAPPLALTPAFSSDVAKTTQWRAFTARSRLAATGMTLEQIVESIAPFVWAPLDAARDSRTFKSFWTPKGPWSPQQKASR